MEGATANFIETEQLLEARGFQSSILQVFLTAATYTNYMHLYCIHP